MGNQKENESGEQHPDTLRAGDQPEQQAGNSGQDDDTGQQAEDHSGDMIQKDPDPLDHDQKKHDRQHGGLSYYLQNDHTATPSLSSFLR